MRMSAGLLLLSLTASGTCIAALFAMLCFLRIRQPANTLSPEGASQLLRAETDMVRTAVQDQARWLRQELGQSLTGFQEMSLAAFGTVRDGIARHVRGV